MEEVTYTFGRALMQLCLFVHLEIVLYQITFQKLCVNMPKINSLASDFRSLNQQQLLIPVELDSLLTSSRSLFCRLLCAETSTEKHLLHMCKDPKDPSLIPRNQEKTHLVAYT